MYTKNDILDVIGITPAELDLFEGSGVYSDEDMQHIDNVRLNAHGLGLSLAQYLELNPGDCRLSTANAVSSAGIPNQPGQSNRHGYNQDVFNVNPSAQNAQVHASSVQTTSTAAMKMAAAMSAQTVMEVAQIYPVFLQQTLSGQFSNDPETRAMQVAVLTPLLEMQERMNADFFTTFKSIYEAPPLSPEQCLEKMESGVHALFHHDSQNPLSILGVTPAQRQLNSAQ